MNESLKVKIINKNEHGLPEYETPGSAGMDLRSNEDDFLILPGERRLVKTGIFIQLPDGYEAQVRPRSGLALKKGISVLNSPGTVDSDYRKEVGVILINYGSEPVEFKKGDRIAQMVVAKHEKVEWVSVDSLDETERKDGFGHTGIS